jgi:hypothetical protein
MTANQWTLAWISIALAVGIVLLARLPRAVLILLVSAVIGAVVGVVLLVTSASLRICDFAGPVRVDKCSGTYVSLFGAHRLPQFMQGSNPDAWLVGVSAFLGILFADVFAFAVMWAWSRRRRNRSIEVPQDAGTAMSR